MNIKILNKNRIDTSGSYALSNIRAFSIDEGSTITENYNETLDSAIIKVSNLTSKMEIDVLDKVILYDDVSSRLSERYFVVDSFNETMISVSPVIYSYEIQLVSETKLLEGVILPNLAITPLKSDKRSIWYYLNQYLTLYSPQVRVGTRSFSNEFVFDTSVQTKFASVECPEMQWNTPTLREVLTDLMMVADCIPVVRHNTIYYIDLTEKKTDITSIMASKVNYISQSKSSSDYCSELQMTMQNVTQTNVDGIVNGITKKEYLTLTSDSAIVNSDNCYLKTQYPIYKIKSLKMLTFTTTGKSIIKDLTDFTGSSNISFVKEYDEYKVLPICYKANNVMESWTLNDFVGYQNFTIYYTRGSNRIDGFNTLTKSTYFYSKSTLEWLQWIVLLGHASLRILDLNSYFSSLFEIEYETTSEQVFKASKDVFDNDELNNKVVVDNQTNSFVDAYNQGFLEYQKANRLGNVNKMINARFTSDWSSLIKIGDYFDDDIIYQCQYQIYNNHIEVNATSCPNYILRDYYTGVKSKLRTWVNATNEALKRHDIVKTYLQFDFNNNSDALDTSYFLSFLNSSTATPLKYCAITTEKVVGSNTIYFPEKITESGTSYSQYYSLELISRVIGNSIVLTCGFNDNYVVDYHIADDDGNSITASQLDTNKSYPLIAYTGFTETFEAVVETGVSNSIVTGKTIGGIPMKPFPYADENSNYEFDKISIWYLTGFSGTKIKYVNDEALSERNDAFLEVCNLPLVTRGIINLNNDCELSLLNKYIYKDNKEIPTISSQYEFSTRTRNIYFTKYFLYLQTAVRTSARPTLNKYEANISDYEFNSLTLPSSATSSSFSYSTSTTYILFSSLSKKAYYLTITINSVEYVVFAFVNDSDSGMKSVYLNQLATRDLRKYSRDTTGILIRTN